MSDAVAPAGGTEPLDLEPLGKSNSRVRLIVALVLIALVVLLGVIFLVSRKPSGYTAEDQQKFMEACTKSGGEPVRGSCSCIYDQMTAKISYERFVEVNGELAGKAQPLQLPADIDAIRADCVARTTPTAAGERG